MPKYEVEIKEVENGIVKGVIRFRRPEHLTVGESIEDVLDGAANKTVLGQLQKRLAYLDVVDLPNVKGKRVELQFEAMATASK